MHEHEDSAPLIERGYEGDDLNIGRLIAFAGGVAALVIFGALGSFVVFHFFVRHEPLGPPATPFENVRTLPPEPRLQTEAPQELNRYRKKQDAILDSYGWVDQAAGIVRIPVTQAMDILLQQGYPVRGTGQAQGNKAKTSPSTPPVPSGAKPNVPPQGAKVAP